RTIRTVDGAGNETHYRYNPDGTLFEQSSGDNLLAYTYDSDGRIETVSDAIGNTTSYVYKPSGRLHLDTNTLGHSRQYFYDNVGNLTRYVNRDGLITNSRYDDWNRRTHEYWVDPQHASGELSGSENATALNVIQSHFDSHGNLYSIADNQTNIDYQFSSSGVLLQESTSVEGFENTVSLDFAFDSLGRLDSRSLTIGGADAPQLTDQYRYDSFQRVDQITRSNFDGTGLIAGIHRDRENRLTGINTAVVHPSATTQMVDTQYAYNAQGLLQTIGHDPVATNGDPLQYQLTYIENSAQLRSVDSALDGLQQFTYDDARQIDTVQSSAIEQPIDYDFDAAGNRSVVTNADGSTDEFIFD
ncbi:MAG: hypothetical protein AAFP90_24065, partial [Planctomycetota bacterium]